MTTQTAQSWLAILSSKFISNLQKIIALHAIWLIRIAIRLGWQTHSVLFEHFLFKVFSWKEFLLKKNINHNRLTKCLNFVDESHGLISSIRAPLRHDRAKWAFQAIFWDYLNFRKRGPLYHLKFHFLRRFRSQRTPHSNWVKTFHRRLFFEQPHIKWY